MNDKLDNLRARAAEAIENHQEHRSSVQSGSEETTPGNVYVFPVQMELALRFAAILSHPDDEQLLFLVPADDFSWVGPTDIAIREHPLGPMVLRCNHGIWLAADDTEQGRLVGKLDPQMVEDTAQMLSDMVTGELSATSEQLQTEQLAEYDEWVAMVEQGVDRLGAWKRRKAAVVDLSDFRSAQDCEPQEDSEPTRLAAAPSGLTKQLQDLDGPSSTDELQVAGWEGPGEVSLLLQGEQLSVVFDAEVDKPPRLEVTDDTGTVRQLQWKSFPGGGLWRSELVDIDETCCVSVILNDEIWAEIRLRG